MPMYRTSLPNASVGRFGGSLVVSMRPYMPSQLEAVRAITARYPGAHGGPIHWGAPAELGISLDLHTSAPDWGEQVSIREGEVPVFWACGVTPQEALTAAKLPLAITHAPGHMLVCDITDSELHVPLDTSDTVEIRACRTCTSRRTRLKDAPKRHARPSWREEAKSRRSEASRAS